METKSKILVIDDEEIVLDSCTQILTKGDLLSEPPRMEHWD